MDYGKFLARCREIYEQKAGRKITKAEFARILTDENGADLNADEHYYMNMEKGEGPKPGRRLLEAAARAAGYEFEDCIQLPDRPNAPPPYDAMIRRFIDALDDAKAVALMWQLDGVLQESARSSRLKRKKTGGRKKGSKVRRNRKQESESGGE